MYEYINDKYDMVKLKVGEDELGATVTRYSSLRFDAEYDEYMEVWAYEYAGAEPTLVYSGIVQEGAYNAR